MKDLFIGVDIGTSSTKVIATDKALRAIHSASRPYPLLTPKPGYAEQNASVIADAIFDGLKEVIAACAAHGTIRAVSLSSAMHGLLFLDADNKPLSNLVTWADKRSKAEAAALQNTEAGKDIYYHTGTPVHPMAPLSKLVWYRQHQPELLQQAVRVVGMKEYFILLATGAFLTDHSIASATGLFDITSRTWYAPALEASGLSQDQLPAPVSTTAVLPPLKPAIADQLKIDPAVPWIIGASDGCLANLGVAADTPAKAALTIGTSGAIRVTTHEPRVDQKRRLFTYILDDNRYIVGGSINNGGIMLQWFKDHLMGRPDDLPAQLAATTAIPAGADGLLCLPYLLGERAPNWNSFDRGVYFGVHYQHTGAHFLKALLEGIAITLRNIGEAMADTCGPFDTLLANGGLLRSPEWLQIIADVFGKRVVKTPGEDASAIGAILLAMQAIGTETVSRDFDAEATDHSILPNKAAHAHYKTVVPLFNELYHKLQADFVRLPAT